MTLPPVHSFVQAHSLHVARPPRATPIADRRAVEEIETKLGSGAWRTVSAREALPGTRARARSQSDRPRGHRPQKQEAPRATALFPVGCGPSLSVGLQAGPLPSSALSPSPANETNAIS